MKNRSDSSMLVSDHRRQMLSWQVVKSTFLSNVARLGPPLLNAEGRERTVLATAAMATSGRWPRAARQPYSLVRPGRRQLRFTTLRGWTMYKKS